MLKYFLKTILINIYLINKSFMNGFEILYEINDEVF